MERDKGYSGKRYFSGLLIGAAFVCLTAAPVAAQTFSSGSTGADGAFSPTANTTLALPPSGVFNFTTVNIPAGVTVTFQKNATNTPVTILAAGDVVIAGTILLDGQPGGEAVAGILIGSNEGEGGPGGFDGGTGSNALITPTGGKGLGPGGGGAGQVGQFGTRCSGGGGGYATAGGEGTGSSVCIGLTAGGPTYGSPALLPLIGGSGGGGGSGRLTFDTGGGGGGGAIVIASSTRIVLTGSIFARGGSGGGSNVSFGGGGAGSGGAVRLVANSLEGSGGSISVARGSGGNSAPAGGEGRIRLESFDSTLVLAFTGTLSLAKPTSVFLTNPPLLQIASVGGVVPPANPTGSFDTPDVILPATATNPVAVSITASQIPLGTPVDVSVIPVTEVATTFTSPGLSGSEASSTASVSVTIPTDRPAVLSATATFTVLASAGHGSVMVAGEPVRAIRVAATYGSGSTVTYITASGKEVRLP
ncbi:MAG: hypothetical protein ACE5G5_04115 [Candidatus Methylomirabilales bacterium]